jgi:hypothetical protein
MQNAHNKKHTEHILRYLCSDPYTVKIVTWCTDIHKPELKSHQLL